VQFNTLVQVVEVVDKVLVTLSEMVVLVVEVDVLLDGVQNNLQMPQAHQVDQYITKQMVTDIGILQALEQ
jgi:hypothetical protein